jgi:hypothetical protein
VLYLRLCKQEAGYSKGKTAIIQSQLRLVLEASRDFFAIITYDVRGLLILLSAILAYGNNEMRKIDARVARYTFNKRVKEITSQIWEMLKVLGVARERANRVSSLLRTRGSEQF